MSEKIIQNWITLAQYDLSTAQAMLEAERYLYVAFTCQQALEKLLKAIYVKQWNKTPPYTHNLIRLLDSLTVAAECDEEKYRLLETLNSYYLESRYTEQISELFQSLTPKTAAQTYDHTRKLFSWLMTKIK